MNLRKVMKTILAVLFCLAVVGTIVDMSEGNDVGSTPGLIAAGCIIAFAIMDHTDRVLAKKRKDNSKDTSEKA